MTVREFQEVARLMKRAKRLLDLLVREKKAITPMKWPNAVTRAILELEREIDKFLGRFR